MFGQKEDHSTIIVHRHEGLVEDQFKLMEQQRAMIDQMGSVVQGMGQMMPPQGWRPGLPHPGYGGFYPQQFQIPQYPYGQPYGPRPLAIESRSEVQEGDRPRVETPQPKDMSKNAEDAEFEIVDDDPPATIAHKAFGTFDLAVDDDVLIIRGNFEFIGDWKARWNEVKDEAVKDLDPFQLVVVIITRNDGKIFQAIYRNSHFFSEKYKTHQQRVTIRLKEESNPILYRRIKEYLGENKYIWFVEEFQISADREILLSDSAPALEAREVFSVFPHKKSGYTNFHGQYFKASIKENILQLESV